MDLGIIIVSQGGRRNLERIQLKNNKMYGVFESSFVIEMWKTGFV